MLTRLQLEDYGGLRLTAATLGAFLKYPREAGEDLKALAGTSSKKFGVFQADFDTLQKVATILGLTPYVGGTGGRGWRRHPLAYVVEAADDICNSILDLEDGVRLGYVSFEEAREAFGEIASASRSYSAAQLGRFTTERDKLGYLRVQAIGVLVEESAEVFKVSESDLLAGRDHLPFVEQIPHKDDLKRLQDIARSRCYNAPDVLEIELSGYEALGGLLKRFAGAALNGKPPKKTLEARTLQFLIESSLLDKEQEPYLRILRVTDYVSGMTDRYALSLYQRTSGISVPGRLP